MYKNQIFNIVSKEYKQFVFTDDVVIITTQEFSDIDKILFQVQKQQRQTVGIGEIIKIKDIINIKFSEAKRDFTIKYYHTNEKLLFDIELVDFEKREAILDELAALKPLKKRENKETKLFTIFTSALYIGLAIYLLYFIRYLSMNNSDVSTTKSRIIVYFAHEILKFIGPTISTIIGVIILAFTILYCFNRFKTPPRIVTYQDKV